jgi:hypothetical protein
MHAPESVSTNSSPVKPSAHGAEYPTISFAVAAWLATNALPFGTERKGITVTGSSLREHSRYCLSYTEVFLIFLPYGSVPLAVAVRVLPIRRHHNSAGDSNLFAFLDCELQRVIINLLVRSRICIRIAVTG